MRQFDGGQLRVEGFGEHAMVVHANHGNIAPHGQPPSRSAFIHIPCAGIVEAEEPVRLLLVEQLADCS